MSNKIQDFLTKNLLPLFDKETLSFSPKAQEEFLESTGGFLDKGYISKLADHSVSTKVFKGICQEVFTRDHFNRLPLPDVELTFEEFTKEYEFGEYTHARQWISHFAKFADRKTIMRYVYDSKG